MNDAMIEKLLRLAPAPMAAAGLREKLLADIRLDARATQPPAPTVPAFWLRRWLAPLSLAAWTMACVTVIGMQTRQLAALQNDNDKLRAVAADLPALREANAELQRLRLANGELDRLRQDEAERARLKSEIAQLRKQLEGRDALRAENQRFKAGPAAPAAAADFFAAAQSRAECVSCVNNLKQIGLAARMWSNDHQGQYPPDFSSMTNLLVTWTVFHCPGDKTRQINSWADVAGGDVSYQLDATGLTERDNMNIVVFECPIHHNFTMLDGSVQHLSEEGISKCITIDSDGRKIFNPPAR
jgi:hypothetical protein